MYVLLGVFPEFPVDPYYEPLVWFMIKATSPDRVLPRRTLHCAIFSSPKSMKKIEFYFKMCSESNLAPSLYPRKSQTTPKTISKSFCAQKSRCHNCNTNIHTKNFLQKVCRYKNVLCCFFGNA